MINEFIWNTEEPHSDNIETMTDYLENHLDEHIDIIEVDGAYAEIKEDGIIYEVHASGNGDFCSHKVKINQLNN